MKTNEIFILCGGILSFVMVIFHCSFYKLFSWNDEFKNIRLANHRIFFTIHIALILLILTFAIISFIYFQELANCKGLACGLTVCYSVFWLWRAIWQIVYFKIPKNVTKVPPMHYITTIIFTVLFILYAMPVFSKLIN